MENMENTKETSGKTEEAIVIIQSSYFHLVQESCNCILELGHYLRRDELSILKEIQEETKSAIERNLHSEIRFSRMIAQLPDEDLIKLFTELKTTKPQTPNS